MTQPGRPTSDPQTPGLVQTSLLLRALCSLLRVQPQEPGGQLKSHLLRDTFPESHREHAFLSPPCPPLSLARLRASRLCVPFIPPSGRARLNPDSRPLLCSSLLAWQLLPTLYLSLLCSRDRSSAHTAGVSAAPECSRRYDAC